MPENIALLRLRRTLLIHRVVQAVLCVLLVYMALHFQQLFAAKGMPQVFRNSLLATLLLQVVLFFPLRRFASTEAQRELAVAAAGTDADRHKQLRQQRLIGDTIKGAVFLGFATFIMIAPPATFVLSTAFFCFIVTVVTYLQCFNFSVRRGLADQPPA
jgi:hypothetical protein